LGQGDNYFPSPTNKNVPILINNINNIIQISAGNNHALILNNIGNVYGFGDNNVNIFLISSINNLDFHHQHILLRH
jgi:alpha-tubulin suppressor-like RCC1 family protein